MSWPSLLFLSSNSSISSNNKGSGAKSPIKTIHHNIIPVRWSSVIRAPWVTLMLSDSTNSHRLAAIQWSSGQPNRDGGDTGGNLLIVCSSFGRSFFFLGILHSLLELLMRCTQNNEVVEQVGCRGHLLLVHHDVSTATIITRQYVICKWLFYYRLLFKCVS